MQTELTLIQDAKPKALHVAAVYFDGGCIGNPGAKYGSYEIKIGGARTGFKHKIQFGHGTSNEAEFDALLCALDDLSEYLRRSSIPRNTVRVAIQTDSTIVRNRLLRARRNEKNERGLAMRELADRCLGRLNGFHSFTAEWKRRTHNVARFGH